MLELLIANIGRREKCVDTIERLMHNFELGHLLVIIGSNNARICFERALANVLREFGKRVKVSADFASQDDVKDVYQNGTIILHGRDRRHFLNPFVIGASLERCYSEVRLDQCVKQCEMEGIVQQLACEFRSIVQCTIQ